MRTDQTSTFAELLKRYRGAAGLTQEALAEQARISARAVSDLERGQERSPRATTLQLLADALRLTPEQRSEFIAAAGRFGRQASGSAGPGVRPPPPAPERPHTHEPLPAPPTWLTPLLGREREMAAVAALLRDGARLVTITGPGGVGKTRLAAAAASALAGSFPGGVAFVDLTAVREPDQVLPTLARALAIREEAGHAASLMLAAALGERTLLLVLDNMEQVAAAGPELAALLAACPRLQAVATSRATLRLQGEHVYQVPPLALPDTGHLPVFAEIADAPAVQLFVERARSARPDFALTVENAAAVAALCHRLDGLPLAIELAAARVRLLPPAALLRQLERDMGVLAGGGADRPERHRTLQGTIAWSYGLLAEKERALFTRLAAFAGGAGLEAVEAVCADPGAMGPDFLGTLEALVDKSLVLVDGEDEPRVRLLETIREYAAERLAASGEEAAVRGRHLACYLALAECAAPRLRGPDQATWLGRLEREHDNARAALRWAREQGDWARGLRLAAALWRFWDMEGYLSEGRAWLESMLASKEGAAGSRAATLEGAGALAIRQGDYGRAAVLLEESLALRRGLGDRTGIAASLNLLANVAIARGNYGRAAVLLDEALALQRALGDKQGIANVLTSLGIVSILQGNHRQAAALHDEALVLRRELGDTWGIAKSLNNLGAVASVQGDERRAVVLMEEALALQRTLGDKVAIANYLSDLGSVMHNLGDYGRAAALHEEALALGRAMGDRACIATSLCGLGSAASEQGDYGRAITLLEEALELQRDLGNKWAIANSLYYLGRVAHIQGDYGRAAALHEEALALRRALGDQAGIAYSLNQLGMVVHQQGDQARAAALLEEGFLLSRDIGARDLLAAGLEGLAWVAARGQPERAARLAGAAESLRGATGVPLGAARQAGHEQMIQSARAALGESGFAAAWAAGQALALGEAITTALEGMPAR